MSKCGDLKQQVYTVHPPPPTSTAVTTTSMAFIPVRYTRPQFHVPVLCSRRLYIHLAILMATVVILVVVRVMTQVRVQFVHYHIESDADAELVTLPASFSSTRGAYCLDGSPPAYYYRPSAVLDVNFWIIHLPSGGWCVSAEDCFRRSLTELGSSHVARTSTSCDGILSNNCQKNPDFCLWNVVILLYCDGGSFLGNVSDVVDYESQFLHLKGALVFDALMEYLLTSTPLRRAEQIVLSGSSAGGIGSIIHADRLRSRLPHSVKTLHVLADAAMFVDMPSVDQQHFAAKMFQSLYALHSMKASASIQECTQTQKPEEEWKCLLPETYHNFVFTPLFFINSVYDSWQRINFLKISCSASACPESHSNAMNSLRDAIVNLALQIRKSRKNGVFITWCPLHTILVRSWFFELDQDNLTPQTSIASWLQHNQEQSTLGYMIDLQSALQRCQKTVTS